MIIKAFAAHFRFPLCFVVLPSQPDATAAFLEHVAE
jgi:hypothetical protein